MTAVMAPSITSAAGVIPLEVMDSAIQNYIASKNGSLSSGEMSDISRWIIYYSYQYNVDPFVMASLIDAESNFHQSSTSSAGAIGFGQLMPDTAIAIGVNPYDPKENIEGACSYLSTQIRNFGSTELALAAYNAGPNAVRKYGGIPPYPETQNYVAKITSNYFNLYNAMVSAFGTAIYQSPQYSEPIYEDYAAQDNYKINYSYQEVAPKEELVDVDFLE